MCWQTLASVLLDVLASSPHLPVTAIGAVRVGDPDATRTVYATVVLLVVLGVVLAALGIWVLRRTRPEPELLAPLETMETRGWRKLDPAAQRRSLDQSRPVGAEPLQRQASVPAVDASFATVAPVASFDDLSDDVVTSSPTPTATEGEHGGDPDLGDPVEADVVAHDESVDSDLDDPDDLAGPALGATVEAERTAAEDGSVDDDQTGDQADDRADDEDDSGPAAAAPVDRDSTGELPDPSVFDTRFDVDGLDDTPVGRSIDPLLAPPGTSPDRST